MSEGINQAWDKYTVVHRGEAFIITALVLSCAGADSYAPSPKVSRSILVETPSAALTALYLVLL